jgi:hypothetical protein
MLLDLAQRARGVLPQGSPLPEPAWRLRHQVTLWVLALHAVGVFGVGVVRGFGPAHSLLEASPLAVAAWRRVRDPARELPARPRPCRGREAVRSRRAVPLRLGAAHLQRRASIGVVAVTPFTASVEEVMQAADAACYTAKDKGRNRVHLYQPDDGELSRRQGESY